MRRRLFTPILAATFAACAGTAPVPEAAPMRAPAAEAIVLVRHGETAPDGTRDPALSPEGEARAARLAALVADLGITAIHTTEYRRTRGTAAPAGAGEGISPLAYDPRALPDFAALLLAAPGRHLVVGHSNTTPELVRLLGGDPGAPIDEHEHDRVYLLVPTGDGIRTFLFRY